MTADDVPAGAAVAVVAAADRVALAWLAGCRVLDGPLMPWVRRRPDVRWVWWAIPPDLDTTGIRACWDLGAVGSLLHGVRSSDPATVWAAAHGLAAPLRRHGGLDLFDLASDDGPLDADGGLRRSWADGGWAETPERQLHWARLALSLYERQSAAATAVADPRPGASGPSLATLTARSESAALLLCAELATGGLPMDETVLTGLLRSLVGDRPDSPAAEAERRRERDDAVLAVLPPGVELDLRSPDQVRALLARLGIDVPDTRSWRLEPYAASSPVVAALLAWRRADRIATTYGWRWLAAHVAAGRLRGPWSVADGGAGRMAAGVGLHNMPAELRPAVRADPGHVLVRADLGQVEPRVLAVVSGDVGLAQAAAQDDMYAPVAAQLGRDRATAKVAVLAAMYGQTSGAAGAALRDMERVYPTALAYLRGAEQVGRRGGELRTYGGRLVSFTATAEDSTATITGRGRYARNAMIQGAAAELFKAWAGTVRAGLAGTGGRIVLCLHDELLLHVRETEAMATVGLLEECLASTTAWWAAGSGVRFVADIGVGVSWSEAHGP